jgi:L-ascorbate metabolism protein UlaG (beta-lactamase superfamily)
VLLTLLRHATLLLVYGGRRLLVDPMLSAAGALPPVANAANDRRIPLVPLPLEDAALDALLASLDGALVTHGHRDHWDAEASARIPRAIPLACQPADTARWQAEGFRAVTTARVDAAQAWLDLELWRTDGNHGRGEVGERMGPSSGFVLRAPGEPTVYLAGDTVWCPAVAAAIALHSPAVVVLNSGAAQFLTGGPITMDVADVAATCAAAPGARIVAVHLEAVNHCLLTRTGLREGLDDLGTGRHLLIPADGESISLE